MLRYENHQVENRDSLTNLKSLLFPPLLRESSEGDLLFIDALSYRIRVVPLIYEISINLIPTGIGRKTHIFLVDLCRFYFGRGVNASVRIRLLVLSRDEAEK